jgi:hypothetical protein
MMRRARSWWNRAAWLAVALWANLGNPVDAQQAPRPASTPATLRASAELLPWDCLPADRRDAIRAVIEKPTVASRAPAEEFTGSPELYRWCLDHPDRVALAWRRLGAPCTAIEDWGDGRFGWSDGQTGEVSWQTVYRSPHLRIWYAEGYGKPGILPAIPVRAVVVFRYLERPDTGGRVRMFHQADLFAQTDSKTAAVIAKLLGPSVARMAEQCVAQMQTFFAALVCYLDQNPDQAQFLLSARRPDDSVRIEYSPVQAFFADP